MTQQEITAFIARHMDAWNRRDVAALSSNHTPAGVVLSPMFHKVEGRAEIRRSYEDLFTAFPDWEVRYDEPFVNGTRVAVFFTAGATHRGEFMGAAGTGRRCAFEGVSLFTLTSDLLIEQERRVYDFTGVLIQLGVLRVREGH